jgi:hypothetical protein
MASKTAAALRDRRRQARPPDQEAKPGTRVLGVHAVLPRGGFMGWRFGHVVHFSGEATSTRELGGCAGPADATELSVQAYVPINLLQLNTQMFPFKLNGPVRLES